MSFRDHQTNLDQRSPPSGQNHGQQDSTPSRTDQFDCPSNTHEIQLHPIEISVPSYDESWDQVSLQWQGAADEEGRVGDKDEAVNAEASSELERQFEAESSVGCDSEVLNIDHPGISKFGTQSSTAQLVAELNAVRQAAIEEYTSSDDDAGTQESRLNTNSLPSEPNHEIYSPSIYNFATNGILPYLAHSKDRSFKKTERFVPTIANVDHFLYYPDWTLLLHTYFEEPMARKKHEGTDKEMYYNPEQCIERLQEGFNAVRFGYATPEVSRVIIRLSKDNKVLFCYGMRQSVFRVKDMVGVTIGRKTISYHQDYNIRNPSDDLEDWQCISIIMKNRTLDFGCKVQGHLIDIWVGISELIIAQQGESYIVPGTRNNFTWMVAKMKLARECKERSLSLNDLMILGIMKAMRSMEHIKPDQLEAIMARIRARFTPDAKLYRIIKLILDSGEIQGIRKMEDIITPKEKQVMRNRLRRKILFGIMASSIRDQRPSFADYTDIPLTFKTKRELKAIESKIHIRNHKILQGIRVTKFNANKPKQEVINTKKKLDRPFERQYSSLPHQVFLQLYQEKVISRGEKRRAKVVKTQPPLLSIRNLETEAHYSPAEKEIVSSHIWKTLEDLASPLPTCRELNDSQSIDSELAPADAETNLHDSCAIQGKDFKARKVAMPLDLDDSDPTSPY